MQAKLKINTLKLTKVFFENDQLQWNLMLATVKNGKQSLPSNIPHMT